MENPIQSEFFRTLYKNHWGKLWIAESIVLLAIGFATAWTFNIPTVSDASATAGASQSQPAIAKIWTCSMHPQIRRERPGKCPLCGMELVPVIASAGGMRTISISPTARKLMNIETVPVERRYVTAQIRMVGKVDYDEMRLSHITAWVPGRLDRMYVNYTGIEVKKGHHMVYIFSEALYAAQEELMQALKNRRDRPQSTTTLIQPIDLVASAREKLRLLGLSATQIKEIEQRKKPSDHITIHSPISGVVIEKLKEKGDRVRTGDRIYTVADLRQVWVKLDAYESDLQWLRYGQPVEFSTDAFPGEKFTGRIAFMDRVLTKKTRTVKVRVNVPNKLGRLKPEMFVRAVVHSRVAAGGRVMDSSLAGKWISPMHPEIIKDEPGKCDICDMPLVRAESLGIVTAAPDDSSKPLVIPVTAAMVTGRRAIVYVEVPTAKEPTFEGREIVLGPRAGAYYLVKHGLKEGELVVINGNFKLDSALQISAKPSMMTPEGGGGGGHDHAGHNAAKTKKGMKSGQDRSLDPQIKKQLHQVIEAYGLVSTAIKLADLSRIRPAFKSFGQAVSKVDAKRLAGHAKMQWREFSMLLTNDAIEGGDVIELQHADQVYLTLKRHLERTRAAFGLVAAAVEPSPIKLDVPADFQAQLGRLWLAYLPVGQALAGDDLSAAKRAMEKLQSTAGALNAEQLKGKAAAVWKKEYASLGKIAGRLRRSADIKAARSAFALLSEEMIALVKSFGVSQTGPIFELHCPMVFDNRGASWLQSNRQPNNPYYGSGPMLKCADQVNLISK